MVVVVVPSCYLLGKVGRGVVEDRSCLVGGRHEFYHSRGEVRIGWHGDFAADEHIAYAVLHGEHGMVFEEAFPVGTCLPRAAVVAQLHDVAAEGVAGDVGVAAVGVVGTLLGECLPIGFEARVVVVVGLGAVVDALALYVITVASELRGHAEPELIGEGEDVLASEEPVERLLVVSDVACVALSFADVAFLPASVGHPSEGAEDAPLPPPSCPREGEPVDVEPHLGDGACVDAERQFSGCQLVVLRFHGLLLGTDGESYLFPCAFDVGLL